MIIKGHFDYCTEEKYILEVKRLYKEQEEKKKNENIRKKMTQMDST